MKIKNDEITVYWSPGRFVFDIESWHLLYEKPISVFKDVTNNYDYKSQGEMFKCPAFQDSMKNLYMMRSQIDENFDFGDTLNQEYEQYETIPVESKLGLISIRENTLKNFKNIEYGMSWVFFAEEPLKARFCAPYFPSVTPTENAYLSVGEFDIGRWFRSYNLDYHIPVDAKNFNINYHDPLVFVEFFTDKKIKFKQFTLNAKLFNIMLETAGSSKRYWERVSLPFRYNQASLSGLNKVVLKEIKNNLVE